MATRPLSAHRLTGMGGICETVLARALCHGVVPQAFPDGVIWVTADRKPPSDLATRLRGVLRAVRDDLAEREE